MEITFIMTKGMIPRSIMQIRKNPNIPLHFWCDFTHLQQFQHMHHYEIYATL